MQRARLAGRWCLPSRREDFVPGTLVLEPGKRPALELHGILRAAEGGDRHPLIWGLVNRAREDGRTDTVHVTVEDALSTRMSMSSAGWTQQLQGLRAYLGPLWLEPHDLTVTELEVEAPGLHYVMGWSERSIPSARLDPPAVVELAHGQTLTLSQAIRAQATDYGTTYQSAGRMRMSGLEAPLGTTIQDVVRPFLDLVTFATGRPEALRAIRARMLGVEVSPSTGASPWFDCFARLAQDRHDPAPPRQGEQVFTIPDLDGTPDLGALLSRWFEFHAGNQHFCATYFGLAYQPTEFVDVRLLNAVSAARALFASSSNDELCNSLRRAAHEAGAPQTVLASLPSGRALAFGSSLKRAFDEHRADLSLSNDADVGQLAERVITVADWYANRNPTTDEAPAPAIARTLDALVRMLITLVLLERMNIPVKLRGVLARRLKLHEALVWARRTSPSLFARPAS